MRCDGIKMNYSSIVRFYVFQPFQPHIFYLKTIPFYVYIMETVLFHPPNLCLLSLDKKMCENVIFPLDKMGHDAVCTIESRNLYAALQYGVPYCKL